MTDLMAPRDGGDIRRVERLARGRDRAAIALIGFTGLFFVGLAYVTSPRPLVIGLGLLVLTLAAWILRPFLALCATMFFALIGDQVTSPWWPATKGMSAQESMMYLHNKALLSPIELCLVAGFVGLVVAYLRTGSWPTRRGRADVAVMIFGGFVVFGVAYGVLTGGSTYFALFQVRPFLNLFALYVLTGAAARSLDQYRKLFWVALVAIEVHALISWDFISGLSKDELATPESIVDHAGVLRMNVLIVAVMASWLFKGISWRQRVLTTAMLPAVLVVYFLAERRSAIVALAVAVLMLLVVTAWRQRSTFRKLAPVLAICTVAYLGAFWNSQGSLGFPAQALKSAIAPDEATTRNQDSDLYRTIENIDLNYTIRASPVLGLGIGKQFYRPVPLPSLSAFGYNEYIPHNSILFLWVAFGFGGFASFFFLVGSVVVLGAAAIRRAPPGRDLVVITTFLLAVVMTVVFAGVDIAWQHEVLVMLGVAIGVISNYPAQRRPTIDLPATDPEGGDATPSDLHPVAVAGRADRIG